MSLGEPLESSSAGYTKRCQQVCCKWGVHGELPRIRISGLHAAGLTHAVYYTTITKLVAPSGLIARFERPVRNGAQESALIAGE